MFLVLGGLLLLGAGCLGAGPTKEENAQPEEQVTIIEPNVMTYTFPGILSAEQINDKQVRVTTDKGVIVFELFADTAPNTVSNFVYLAGQGYFDGVRFHRREEGFVIQGGDPQSKDLALQPYWGTGGPGYKFADELEDEYTYERGIVAMANAGPNTNGSQFFIMLADVPLPKLYTVFGRVVEGMDVVDSIAVGDVMTSVAVEGKE